MKKDTLAFQGRAIESYPSAMFLVRVESDSEFNGKEVLCSVSGRMRHNKIMVQVGDWVSIEVPATDQARGVITFRDLEDSKKKKGRSRRKSRRG